MGYEVCYIDKVKITFVIEDLDRDNKDNIKNIRNNE